MGVLAGLGDCPLAVGDNPGHCSWCGVPLTGRRKRWCSDEHAMAWAHNHSWGNARAAALLRDGHRCTICGNGERYPELEWWVALIRWWWSWQRLGPLEWWREIGGDGRPFMRRDHTNPDAPHDSWREWRAWADAQPLHQAEHDPAWEAWRRRQQLDRRLEVDHIEPCLGAHAENSCKHHLSGLRTLCHRCHLIVTAEQFGRAPASTDAQPALFGAVA